MHWRPGDFWSVVCRERPRVQVLTASLLSTIPGVSPLSSALVCSSTSTARGCWVGGPGQEGSEPLRRPRHRGPRGRDEAWPRAGRLPAVRRKGSRRCNRGEAPGHTPLSGVEWQLAMYAEGLPADVRRKALTKDGPLPFVFEASGTEDRPRNRGSRCGHAPRADASAVNGGGYAFVSPRACWRSWRRLNSA